MDQSTSPALQPGICTRPHPGLRRILAPNPSHMTYWGTNTHIIGTGEVAVLDPGPDLDAHLSAIMAALGPEERVTHILVSHSHADHIAAVPRLKDATGAEVLAFQTDAFTPDRHIPDGTVIAHADWQVEAIHTPGHIDDHLCFAMGDICLTADHVMGWATSVIIPPRGDVTDYVTSLEKLAARNWTQLFPAHGLPIDDPAARLEELIRHRHARSDSILRALKNGPMTVAALVARLYVTTPQVLRPAATRNVEAHMIDLLRKGSVTRDGDTYAIN